MNDQGQPSSSPSADGIIATVQGAPATAGQLQLTAVQTILGPMAFAVYTPPTDFSRGGSDDGAANRYVLFRWQVGSPLTTDLTTSHVIWRPPVVLVHGLFGAPDSWDTFFPFNADPRFAIQRASYKYSIPDATVVSPVYPMLVPVNVNANALGLAANAPTVLAAIKEAVVDFRTSTQSAGAQADVVAHSLGGVITRTLENLPDFNDQASWGVGVVHKLITIGTPHLGSPVAAQLLNGNNDCVRNTFAALQMTSISPATVPELSGTLTGGVGDMQPLSPAILAIQSSNGHEVPTALVAGTANVLNTSSLDTSFAAGFLQRLCSSDFLAVNLTSSNWTPNVFGEGNDGIVGLTSQQNLNMGSFVQDGVVHSGGVEQLGFTGPTELSPSSASQIQTFIITLLNTKVQTVAPPFYLLP
jgi:pimeloyl-ACP methyl ester carboxylesterase